MLGLQLAVVAGLVVEVAAAAKGVTFSATRAVVKGTSLTFAQQPGHEQYLSGRQPLYISSHPALTNLMAQS